ncbi:MAG TPA: queuosine salvage family protein [Solirubrobacterales bacterium]
MAARARWVRIDEARIERYAAGVAGAAESDPAGEPSVRREPEAAAAFAICMNAINFGSGWWPTIRKRPGLSGYSTMEAGISERFDSAGPWSAGELAAVDGGEIAAVVGQDPGHPLMEQFAAALRDVGARLLEEHGGRYVGVVEGPQSIPDLAATFGGWKSFADVSEYEERGVPFFKRAQLAAADLHRAGVADLPGIGRLTAFADNLVPHVLRLDGVLHLDPGLTAKIDAGTLLLHGSPEEVELRACAVHAVELISAAGSLAAAEIDSVLWNRGRERRYKARARPRSRNLAY